MPNTTRRLDCIQSRQTGRAETTGAHSDSVYTRQKPQVVIHKYPQHALTDTAVVARILHTQRLASLLLQVQSVTVCLTYEYG